MDKARPDGRRYETTDPRYLWGAAVVVVVTVGGGLWLRQHHRARHAPKHAPSRGVVAAPRASAAPSSTVAAAPSAQAAASAITAVEVWVRNPDVLAGRLYPHIVAPGTKPKGPVPTVAQLLKNGPEPTTPAERETYQARARDLEELDFSKPLGYVLLPPQGDGATRFVTAVSVKDPARAVAAVEDYTRREGATSEKSARFGMVYKGSHTGRYMAWSGAMVLLASDAAALEQTADVWPAGIERAKTQAHDIVASAPRAFVTGPFVKWVEKAWMDWSAPQLGGATSGPAKALFDEIATRAQSTWPGAGGLSLHVDVSDSSAEVTAALEADPDSAFSRFLATYPTGSSQAMLAAPRDGLTGVLLNFPLAWLPTAQKFLTTPPPGVTVPQEMLEKTEAVFKQFAAVLDGEVLMASVADPPAEGNVMRLKVHNEDGARNAARELVRYIAPGMTFTPLNIEGGSGEGMEITPAPQPPQPPLPPSGLAWAVRGGYLYVARGALPKRRLLRVTSSSEEEHLATDHDIQPRIASLPANVALAAFSAPLRTSSPLPAALGMTSLPQALVVSAQPGADGLKVRASLDLDLLAIQVRPLLMGPQQLPPGAVPPDAAGGLPPGMQPGVPPGVGPGGRPAPGSRGAGGGAGPRPVLPAAPTGYVLPVPEHHTSP